MAEGTCRADTRHTLEGWEDVDVGVVSEELRIVATILARERIDEQHTRLPLLSRHPDTHDIGWEEGLRLLDTVLHIDRCHIGVGAFLEVDRDGRTSGVGRRRGHIGHPFDPVDLLFEGNDDGVKHRLSVGTCVGGGDLYGGWGEVGVLLDGQLYEPDDPEDDDEDGDHRREDWARDKSIEVHCAIGFGVRLSVGLLRPAPSSADGWRLAGRRRLLR